MVYFITDGTIKSVDRVKIGYTDTQIKTRLGGLQTGNPEELICLWEYPGDRILESKLHNYLSAYRIRGEWFKYNEEVKLLLATFFRNLMPFKLTPDEHWWLGK